MNLMITRGCLKNRCGHFIEIYKYKLNYNVSRLISIGSTVKHLTKLGPGNQLIYSATTRGGGYQNCTCLLRRWSQCWPSQIREFRTYTVSGLRSNSKYETIETLLEKMSRHHTASFIDKRNKRQKLKSNIGNFSLQVIGTGSLECPPSLLIISDSTRYLFNCGEGTQRLLMENGVKNISRLENIFLTRMKWENIGGLIGMTITLKNVGLPKVHYHGPPNMKNFVDALQIFAKHEKINIGLRPYTAGVFENECMSVTPVPIFEKESSTSDHHQQTTSEMLDGTAVPEPVNDSIGCESKDKTASLSKGMMTDDSTSDLGISPDDLTTANTLNDVISDMNVRKKSTTSAKKKRSILDPDLTVAYICKVHKRARSLIVKKAIALGLPPGPKYTDLKNGLTVKTDSGQEIHPEDVLAPDVPSYPFIVLQCPSVQFLDSLCNNEALQSCHAGNGENSARLIIHMTPTNVIQHPRYQQWMKRFGPEAEHLILNRCQASASHESARGLQAKLNLMHPEVFPLLHEPSWKDLGTMDEGLKLVKAETYLRYHFHPPNGFDRSLVPTLNTEPYIKAAKEMEHFTEDLETFKANQTNDSTKKTEKYPEVVFLGTGSAMPNKERNVSCIMINLSEDQTMILDAGEGSFAQMCRFYGNKLDNVFSKLYCIFISHIHADHHVGLVQILRYWKQVLTSQGDQEKDLLLVGPKRLIIWLNQYNKNCEDFIHKVRFVELSDFTKEKDIIPRNGLALLKNLNLIKFETVPVIHCAHAYGVAISHKDGWKIVYSGDTMPCQALVEAGMDADLLIHEATLEDGMEEDARLKRHSMTSEAIDIGIQMRSKFIVLTHFSQRYSKIPFFGDQFSDQVGMAFDNMKVSLSEFHILPKLIPAMKSLFAEALQELEDIRDKKIEKRSLPPDIQDMNLAKKHKNTIKN